MDARRALAVLERSPLRPMAIAVGAAALAILAAVGATRLLQPGAKVQRVPLAAAQKAPRPELPPPAQEKQALVPVAEPALPLAQAAELQKPAPGAKGAPMEQAPIQKALGTKAPPAKNSRSSAAAKPPAKSSKAGVVTAGAKAAFERADSGEALNVSNQAQQVDLQQFAPSKAKPWRKTSVKQVELEPGSAPAPKNAL